MAGEKNGWQGNQGNHRSGEGRVVFDAIGLTTPVTAENFAESAAEIVARELALVLKDEDGKRILHYLTAKARQGTILGEPVSG